MSLITLEQLKQIVANKDYITAWCEPLNDILPKYEINNTKRVAAFLAQTSYESMFFVELHENLNYRAETLVRVFPKEFPNLEIANQYAHQQQKIANRAYALKLGNGDESSGDGWKYRGRGLIQLTGKTNYKSFATFMVMNLDDVGDYLESIEGAIHSACFSWKTEKLNDLADAGEIDRITRIINGPACLGKTDRANLFNKAIKILGDSQ